MIFIYIFDILNFDFPVEQRLSLEMFINPQETIKLNSAFKRLKENGKNYL